MAKGIISDKSNTNVAARITSMTAPNNISVGEDVFSLLHPKIRSRFEELLITGNEWKYVNRSTGNLYRVYSLQ